MMTDEVLAIVKAKIDETYAERGQVVALAARMALSLGWRTGIAQHLGPWDEDWRTIVFIDAPAGQISWHMHDSEKPLLAGLPAYPAAWDGHDTAEKYRRVNLSLHPEHCKQVMP